MCSASLACIETAFAQTTTNDGQQRAVTVRYSDLNLSSAEGSRVLYARLTRAAEQVCPEKSDTPLALRANRDANECIANAIERAVQQIKHPRLAEVAASRRR
jgi:UrcA family protein